MLDMRISLKKIKIRMSKHSSGKAFAVMNVHDSLSQSTFIANYALMCARNGEKVLIVDTDYHRNDFLRAFHFKQTKGLFSLLQNDADDYQSYIHSLDINKNLSVLPAGQLQDNETSDGDMDSLSYESFSTLYAALMDKFDLILVNLVSSTSVTEAIPILEVVDGTILIVDLNSTRKKDLHTIIHDMIAHNYNIVGYVDVKR
ncbi:capsular polysaccharide biosynthesis protein [Lactiplantibacillus plantarum]|nr:capsular polysaccharide biosynthesis protein [Lactiplantibacillus plantarum]MCG0792587.1 capsular polysaccharide biosynthesis protein [Lactiplantibacillus plantarum]